LRNPGERHMVCDTMATLRRLIGEAIETATPTVEDCAAALGLSSSALRRYRLGDRVPSADLVTRLARLLRRRAAVMVRLATELEATVTEEADDA
jgi:transcriptional regulator with XRE-family HTH domain